jgi:hypothetical protein
MSYPRNRLKYPKVHAMVVQIEEAESRIDNMQWLMGDVLLEECGPPPNGPRSDGSYDKLKECAAELEATGHPKFSTNYIARLREVAHTNPPKKRIETVSWSAHQEADDPDFLAAVVKEAKKRGEAVTQDYVRAVRRTHFRQVEAQQAKLAGIVTGAGKSVLDTPPRPRDAPNPEPTRIGLLMTAMDLNEVTRELRRRAELAQREIEKIDLNTVQSEFFDVSIEDLVGTMQIVQALTEELRKRTNRRGRAHLTVA